MARLNLSFLSCLNTFLHEPVNCITHGLGALFSVVGVMILVLISWGQPLYVVSFIVYGLSSVLLYVASSLYHGLKVNPRRRRMLLRLDHVGIYALIAGSYTPLALIALKSYSPVLGWAFFGLVWALATLGIVFKLWWLDAPVWLSTGLYLLLGWLALGIMPVLLQTLSAGGLLLLFLGGLLYSVGAVIFAVERPDFYPGVFGHHELWHLFVLAGGACHYLLLLIYLTPK